MTKDDDLIVHVMLPNLVLNPGLMKISLDSALVQYFNLYF
jgi:hypothetical protein